jgi:hypothetical protein
MNILLGIFFILHGLVHFWYVTLIQGWVRLEAEMGWSGSSWLLGDMLESPFLSVLATSLLALSALGFVGSGIGLLGDTPWTRTLLWISSLLSALTLVVIWDGGLEKIVEKGLIGLLINLVVILVLIFR